MSDQLINLQQQLTASSHALAIKEAEHQLIDAQRNDLNLMALWRMHSAVRVSWWS
jgi:hypothetical protein